MSEQEKSNALRSVTITTKQEMPIALGTFEYIAGIDPRETWAPFSDDEMDVEEFEKMRTKHMDIIKSQESTKEFQDKLKEMLQESLTLYQGIMSANGDVFKPYIEGRMFNFVLGMPRTGGTTVYQGLSDAYGWPWEKLLLSMTHNFMPNGGHILSDPTAEFDMGWRLPWNFNNLVFELSQFLVYINNVAPDSEHIFIKSTALSYAVKLLNFLFADKANYFITVRHPGAITMTSGKEDITREDHMETMAMWSNLYSSMIRECRPLGRMRVVEYGAGMTEIINLAFEQTKVGERIEETSFFELDEYDKDFYESDAVKRMFDYVKTSWELFDIDFPIPDKCI
ncbi:MAG: hypothetical protein C0603_12730 [Denitrovibrio sp.]|nr:MAG: hypothetical protein C0603_12730 [Denitrovibrio sp.]